MLIHRGGAENAEEAQSIIEASVIPLRRLCASAVNEVSLTRVLRVTRGRAIIDRLIQNCYLRCYQ
jgi:hypothetical protein